MTAYNYLHLTAIGFALLAWGGHAYAEGDVTIVTPPSSSTNAAPQNAVAPDGTPVVHKSSHKKKTQQTAAASTSSQKPAIATPAPRVANDPPPATLSKPYVPSSVTAPAQSAIASGPAVETGLPIAKHAGIDTSTPIPTSTMMHSGVPDTTPSSHHMLASSLSPLLPSEGVPGPSSTTAGSYSPQAKSTLSTGDFVFSNYSRRSKNVYPWKTRIITTMFYIGEGGSAISSTANIDSAWVEDWRGTNGGTDTPGDRSGYSPADHAARVNPFYVALPFNDLAYPDKAREWLPAGWHRPNQDGKPVSACKDRWVEIKNAQGHICYAQWEDVGPLVSDHAEYVFGDERPDTLTRAGLDVSPAVAKYLNIDGENNRYTSWRFVDEEDVPPGAWLKYDELALLYAAMHQMKNPSTQSSLPIQRASEPIDDPSNIDSNKKKVGAAKG